MFFNSIPGLLYFIYLARQKRIKVSQISLSIRNLLRLFPISIKLRTVVTLGNYQFPCINCLLNKFLVKMDDEDIHFMYTRTTFNHFFPRLIRWLTTTSGDLYFKMRGRLANKSAELDELRIKSLIKVTSHFCPFDLIFIDFLIRETRNSTLVRSYTQSFFLRLSNFLGTNRLNIIGEYNISCNSKSDFHCHQHF